MGELKVVGKSIPRVDALEKVTGKARYSSDFKMSRMLHAKVLRSPYAHARILSIDTSKAEKLPGVRAVVTGDDAPDMRIGLIIWDHYILPRDKLVRGVGEPVAAVAADTIEIAEEALGLIDVEYEELPAIFDPEEAIKQDPPVVVHPDLSRYFWQGALYKALTEPDKPNVCYHFKIRTGDVDKAFQGADLIVENRFSVARIQHCQLETSQADAWVESDGTLTVRTSCQQPETVREQLSALFRLPPAKVRIIAPYTGGGFGGKSGTGQVTDGIAVLLALKSGRPVRLVLTREEQFIDGRQRGDIITFIKDGVKADGTLVARQIKVILNLGHHADTSAMITRNLAFGAVGVYRVPNFKLDSYGVYTNLPLTGPFRGFGSPEINWAIEQHMDIIAEKLGIDAVEIRKRNTLREGERNVCGQATHSIGVNECLDKVAEWIGWGKKTERMEGPWKKGKGIAIGCKYSIVGRHSVVIVKVHSDGTIEVRHGSDEIGQGINTIVAQIAAEEFGVPVTNIKVVRGDTAFCPYDFGSVSQRSTFNVGNALIRACQDAKRQLLEIAAGKLGVSTADLRFEGGKVSVTGWPGKWLNIGDLFSYTGVPLRGGEIIGTASYCPTYIREDPETGQSEKITNFFTYGAHAAEVAVNMETGEVKILRVAGAFDTSPINPKMVEGQIEGGTVQGIGGALYEQVVMDKGVVVNPSFMDYKIPTTMALPTNENLNSMIVPVPHREGPFEAKGVGESTYNSIIQSIANAVYNAVKVRVKDLPITREKVLKGLMEKGS